MLEKKIKHKFAFGQVVYFIDYLGVPNKGNIECLEILSFLGEEGKDDNHIRYEVSIQEIFMKLSEKEIFATPEELANEIVKKLKEEKNDCTKKN